MNTHSTSQIKNIIENKYPGAKIYKDYEGIKFTISYDLRNRVYLLIDTPVSVEIYDNVSGVLVEKIKKQ